MKKVLTMLACVSFMYAPQFISAQTMVISTVAGDGTTGHSGDGGPASAAKLFNPEDVAVDASGNLYIADTRNQAIRKVDAATGTISTIVGQGSPGFYGDGIAATAAYLNYPSEVKLDAAGNIYINDGLNYRIRKINAATGIISTIAGGGSSSYYNGMPGTAWNNSFRPAGLGVDAAGNCYFLDFSATPRVLRLDAATGIITAIADSAGIVGYSGDGGLAVDAQVNNLNYYPGISLGVDAAGNVYITDTYNERIRKIDHTTGIITTIAGTGAAGFTGDGGPATAAQLSLPNRIAIDNAGSIYFFNYNQVRKIDGTTQTISVIAGGGTSYAEGIPATAAKIYSPYGIAVDGADNVYYADNNGRVRKLTPACGSATAGTITAAGTLCTGDSTTVSLTGASAGVDVSYQWEISMDGVNWSVAGTNGLNYNSGIITAPVYVKALVTCNTFGVSDSTAVDTLAITPPPLAGPITGADSICPGNTLILSDAVSGGVWSGSDNAVAVVNTSGMVTGIATGFDTVTYIITNGCGADTASVPVYVKTIGECNTSVQLTGTATRFNVYPNPGNGTFTATLESLYNEDVRVIITNPLGEKVQELSTHTNAPFGISLNVPSGIYMLTAITAHGRYDDKLVIIK